MPKLTKQKLQDWRVANHLELIKCKDDTLEDVDLKLPFELPSDILREAYYQVTVRQRGILNTLIARTAEGRSE